MATSFFAKQTLPHIHKVVVYQPGKPVSELQREYELTQISKLASNENPLGASPKVAQAIQTALADIGRYPDGHQFYLKQALADFLHLSSSQIALGNGSNELLSITARVFAGAGDEIIYSQYAFPVYAISTQSVGATGVEVPANHWGHDLEAMVEAITERTKLIYLANPNNPTGTFFGRAEWENFIQKVPSHVIVVLDEAYTEYVTDPDFANGLHYLGDYPNLLVSRTFSKAYGLAALRVGYMAGHPEVISYINRIREPFNINHLAQVAAQAALSDQAFVQRTVTVNQQGMASLTQFFDDMAFRYIPSQANFLCVRLGADAAEIHQALLQEGVIVRPVASQGTFAEFLRVSIGLPDENAHFMQALRHILNRSR